MYYFISYYIELWLFYIVLCIIGGLFVVCLDLWRKRGQSGRWLIILVTFVTSIMACVYYLDLIPRITLIAGSMALITLMFKPRPVSELLEKHIVVITGTLGLGVCWIAWPLDIRHDTAESIVIVPSAVALMFYSLWTFLKQIKVSPGTVKDII